MSLIKSIMHQLGLSGDPAKNFTLSVPAAPDGTMKLARGNAGVTTQDIMTVDAAGKVAFPQNLQTKVFTGVMPSAEGQAVSFVSGVVPSKYVSISAVVQATGDLQIAPGDPNAKISVFGSAGNIGVFIIPGGVNNTTLYGRPVKAILTYEA
jgi:hypothetical protein